DRGGVPRGEPGAEARPDHRHLQGRDDPGGPVVPDKGPGAEALRRRYHPRLQAAERGAGGGAVGSTFPRLRRGGTASTEPAGTISPGQRPTRPWRALASPGFELTGLQANPYARAGARQSLASSRPGQPWQVARAVRYPSTFSTILPIWPADSIRQSAGGAYIRR